MAWTGTPVAASGAVPTMAADGVTGVNTMANYRQGFLGTLISPATGGPMAWRQGVFPTTWSAALSTHTDLLVQAGASRNLTVQAGNCVVVRSGIAGGPYIINFNAATTIVLDPADATNPRIDTVFVKLNDQAIGDPAGTQGGYLIIVNGTAASSPSAPATPTGCVPLMDVRRAAGVDAASSATYTDRRFSAGTYGGIRPLLGGDSASAAGAYIGETTYTTAGGLRWWDGSQWRGTSPITYRLASNSAVTAVAGTNGILQTQVIPDPGWPYFIQASGGYFWDTGGSAGIFASATINIDQASVGTTLFDGNCFAWGTMNSSTASNTTTSGQNQFVGTNTGITANSLTGSHTIRFWWRNDSGVNYNIHLNMARLNIVVTPL